MWGLYGLVYAAMGVATRCRRREEVEVADFCSSWRLGYGGRDSSAAMLGFVVALDLMLTRSGGERDVNTVISSGLGRWRCCSGVRVAARFSYVFTGGGGRFWLADAEKALFGASANGPIVIATLVAAVLYAGVRRSRYSKHMRH